MAASMKLIPGPRDRQQQAVGSGRRHRGNAMIKIPATLEGLPAICNPAKGLRQRHLIFSLERYEQVIDAFIEGIAPA